MAQKYFDELREAGVQLSEAEVVWVHQLGEVAQRGASDLRMILCTGERIGNVTLYPLSFGAEMWLITEATDWFDDDPEMETACTVYAFAHSYDRTAFFFNDRADCKQRVLEWNKTVLAPAGLVHDAIQRFTDARAKPIRDKCPTCKGTGKEPPKPGAAVNPEALPVMVPMLSLLTTYHGQTIDYWLWSGNSEVATQMVQSAIRQENAKKGQAQPIDTDSPQVKAYAQLGDIVQELRETWEAQKNSL